jgi:hypothetical protein
MQTIGRQPKNPRVTYQESMEAGVAGEQLVSSIHLLERGPNRGPNTNSIAYSEA